MEVRISCFGRCDANLCSLPGALGMYGLAVGVSNIGERLPRAVYALLSGLNSATVGLIAQAAVELSEKAITDKMSLILVFLGATAGMLYTALWYFPVLMALAGMGAVLYDYKVFHPTVKWIRHFGHKPDLPPQEQEVEMGTIATATTTASASNDNPRQRPLNAGQAKNDTETIDLQANSTPSEASTTENRIVPADRTLNISWKFGAALLAGFFLSFVVVMVLRGVLPHKPLLFELFTNMYLAGTIIFGGGPVVIPLLREYVVSPGWVSPRDFLLGLALIQSFPGPNFNFAVYLGGLTAVYAGSNVAAGSIIAYLGIFFPGLIMVHGTMGIWNAVRGKRWVKSLLRGINAGAVGLVYTAVYRLWQIGYVDFGFETGRSLGDDPWWVVVCATAFASGRWFGVPAPAAIVLGGTMGLIRYGVVST